MLVLGAYRATEAHAGGFADALAELRRERLVTQIEVGGLRRGGDDRARSRCAPGRSPAASFCHALYEETEGNPFFIEEIVRHLAEAGVRADQAERARARSASACPRASRT